MSRPPSLHRGHGGLSVPLPCENTPSWVMRVGPPASLWFPDDCHLVRLGSDHSETRCTPHMLTPRGSGPLATSRCPLGTSPPVTSSHCAPWRSCWLSHLQVWSGVKEDDNQSDTAVTEDELPAGDTCAHSSPAQPARADPLALGCEPRAGVLRAGTMRLGHQGRAEWTRIESCQRPWHKILPRLGL